MTAIVPIPIEEARERTKRDMAARRRERREREAEAASDYNDYFAHIRKRQLTGT